MISIAENMDEHDIAREIRLERQVHKGSFLLLEGDDDLKRFTKFTDQKQCSTVNCFGRANLIGAIALLYDEGFPGTLGLADADFDRITDSLVVHEGIIYSDSHDFDLDWACKDVLDRYLEEVAQEDKCRLLGGTDGVATFIFDAARPLSVMRYVNHSHNLHYSLKRVRHHVVAPDAIVDLNILVDHVSTGQFSGQPHKNRLRDLVLQHAQHAIDLRQITNGHDFLTMLGVALQDKIGDREIPQTWGSEIELHFRLAYSEEDFIASTLFIAILHWQDENPPYVVLKPSLIARRP